MKLSAKEKASYGLGAVGKDMVYMLSASYILYYYQDLLGVSSWVMGVIHSAEIGDGTLECEDINIDNKLVKTS